MLNDRTLTAMEVDLLAHAVGYCQRPGDEPPATLWACYRNAYAAGADLLGTWEDLTVRGLAELVRGPVEGVFPEPLYRVTPKGFALLVSSWGRICPTCRRAVDLDGLHTSGGNGTNYHFECFPWPTEKKGHDLAGVALLERILGAIDPVLVHLFAAPAQTCAAVLQGVQPGDAASLGRAVAAELAPELRQLNLTPTAAELQALGVLAFALARAAALGGTP